MFIVIVSRGVPSKRDPQWGCFEKDQAEALVALGHKVVVISVDGRFRFYYRKHGIKRVQLNNIHYLDSYILPLKVASLFCGWKCAYKMQSWQLEKLLQTVIKEFGKPDIIYTHYLNRTYIALPLKQKYNIPIVAIEHWSEVNKDKLNKIVQQMGRNAYPNVDIVIAVSESLKERIAEHFGVDAIVVHNMAHQSFFKKNDKPIERKKLRFVSVGSLIPIKGHELLIRAFAKLKLSPTTWELMIVGAGPEKNNLQTQIDDAHLQDNIQLVGRKGKDEIVDILRKSSAFMLPSRTENFSVAVLEALACGLPVIASICGGIRECINQKNGLLFPVDDVDALANAIKYMVEHYDEYDREKIAADCKARFSPEVIAQQLTEVFEKAIAKQKE